MPNHNEHHHHHHDNQVADIPAERAAVCPVTGDAIDTREAEKLGHFRDYNGQRIYLCCGTCVKLFDEDPQKYTPALYQCKECNLHYSDEATAKACETWCKQYKSCNLEITKQSVEHQQGQKQTKLHEQSPALRLFEKEKLIDNIWSFRFKANRSLSWVPGQFIRVEIPHDNPDSEGTKRWFTISSTPDEGFIQITTRITGSTFKQALNTLSVNASIKLLEEPDGDFVWREDERPLILIAGGIGVTPFYSMLKNRGHSRKPASAILIYNGRDKQLAFSEEFEQAAKRHPEFSVIYIIGERLAVDKIKELVPEFMLSQVYVSGPEPMVESFGKELIAAGLPKANMHQDFFPNYTEENY